MRGFLASSIGVTCAVVLTLPLTLPTGARAVAPRATDVAPPTAPRTLLKGNTDSTGNRDTISHTAVPGRTQSLPLTPLTPPVTRAATRTRATATDTQGLTRRTVRPFSLLGIVWRDARAVLDGDVQVRTRATATGTWSPWRTLDAHTHDHAADPGSAEARSTRVRGATAPLWVGASDGVEVRVTRPARGTTTERHSPLPAGLRLELVDPGPEPSHRAGTRGLPAPDVPDLTDLDLPAGPALALPAALGRPAAVAPALATAAHTAPRPAITSRKKWGADESLREGGYAYTGSVKAAFVHHSATGNNYTCAQAPSVIRGIYRYHVTSSGWRDIGYNFLIDKCGTVYEGRAGGVAKAVLGAHTLGFNGNTMGIAVLGSYGSTTPPAAAVRAVARLTAWKLGLSGANPQGKTYLTSAGGNLYRKGEKVRLHRISGHRDGVATGCPGARLYAKLGTARSTAARLQGR
ncbi:peptidoglycan recognition protein family protein [Streptomyces sp. LE64]|uniref:peptidoglycan recognition protein family protein n=1 Tax=Streptomyces sp. LE64 TaxID=3448653 RepID=UPI0040411924